MKWRVFCILTLALVLLAGAVNAKRILFYEVGTSADYTIEGGFSNFADELKSSGNDIASITRGDMSRASLEPYDILVIPSLGKSLTTEEVSSIIEFVQKGKGLFVVGAGGSTNQITPLFGVTIDSGTLIDTTHQIPNVKDRSSFTTERFNDQTGMSTLRYGVTKIGFYKGSGLKLSSDVPKVIAEGSSETYSDTGSFAAGSYPPVATASIFGNGLVVITSDADFLTNKNIGDYNNKRFGLNIIEWLSLSNAVSPGNSTQELQYVIAENKLELARLQLDVQRLTDEKNALQQQNSQLTSALEEAEQQLLEVQAGMIGPFSKTNWAIIILGVCILVAAIVFSKRKAPAVSGKVRDEDILGELGYELEGSEQKGASPKTGGKDLESELDNIKL